MEMSDEYQDMGNPGGGVAMVNMPMARHQHTPVESPVVSLFFFFFSIHDRVVSRYELLTSNRKCSKNTGRYVN